MGANGYIYPLSGGGSGSGGEPNTNYQQYVEDKLKEYMPLDGGVVTGAISFQSVDNGYCGVTKHHDENNDYGMLLQDTDKDGNISAIKICATTGKAIFQKSANDSKEILHSGNIESYTGSNEPMTEITFTDVTNWSNSASNLKTFYIVKNGWCFLHVVAHCNKVANDDHSIVFNGLPIPPFQVYGKFAGEDNTYEPCHLTVGTGGQMLLRGGTEDKDYSFTYTYPVAD